MTGLMTKVAFASKISILMKATSDDINPAAGYLFNEINKITYEQQDYCDHLLEFLLDRLKKKSIYIKMKVLLVLKNVVQDGNPEFARGLRKEAEPLRELQGHSGPPHPLHGDIYHAKVRQTAKEVLEVLFDVEKPPVKENVPTKSIVEGFGNSTIAQNESFMKSVIGRVKEAVPSILSVGATSSKVATSVSQDTMFKKYLEPSMTAVTHPSSTFLTWNSSKDTSSVSSIGGNSISPPWDSCASYQNNNTSKSFIDTLSPEKADGTTNWDFISGNNSNTNQQVESSQKSERSFGPPYDGKNVDMHYNEKKIVDEITHPQGLKVQPQKQDITSFVKRSKTLDTDVIVKQLSMKLNKKDSRIQLRTMYVLESLWESNLPNIRASIKRDCMVNIIKFQRTSNFTTRNRAEKLLRLMDGDITHSTFGLSSSNSSNPTSGSSLNNMIDPAPEQKIVADSKESNLLDLQLDPFHSHINQTTEEASSLTQVVNQPYNSKALSWNTVEVMAKSKSKSNTNFVANIDELHVRNANMDYVKTNAKSSAIHLTDAGIFISSFGTGEAEIKSNGNQAGANQNILINRPGSKDNEDNKSSFSPSLNSNNLQITTPSYSTQSSPYAVPTNQLFPYTNNEFSDFQSAISDHANNVQSEQQTSLTTCTNETILSPTISNNDIENYQLAYQSSLNSPDLLDFAHALDRPKVQQRSDFGLSNNNQSLSVLNNRNKEQYSSLIDPMASVKLDLQKVKQHSNLDILDSHHVQLQTDLGTINSLQMQYPSNFSRQPNLQMQQQGHFRMQTNPQNFSKYGNLNNSTSQTLGNFSSIRNASVIQRKEPQNPGFSFISGTTSKKKSGDAFSFVEDAMRASRKK